MRMADYWISDDWKVKVKTLESYLSDALKGGIYDHLIRASEGESGTVQFTIHPANVNGETIDYKVLDNRMYPADPAFGPPYREALICFMRTKDGFRLAEMSTFTARVNMLDELYLAVRREDQDGIRQAMLELQEQDRELGEEEGDEDD